MRFQVFHHELPGHQQLIFLILLIVKVLIEIIQNILGFINFLIVEHSILADICAVTFEPHLTLFTQQRKLLNQLLYHVEMLPILLIGLRDNLNVFDGLDQEIDGVVVLKQKPEG